MPPRRVKFVPARTHAEPPRAQLVGPRSSRARGPTPRRRFASPAVHTSRAPPAVRLRVLRPRRTRRPRLDTTRSGSPRGHRSSSRWDTADTSPRSPRPSLLRSSRRPHTSAPRPRTPDTTGRSAATARPRSDRLSSSGGIVDSQGTRSPAEDRRPGALHAAVGEPRLVARFTVILIPTLVVGRAAAPAFGAVVGAVAFRARPEHLLRGAAAGARPQHLAQGGRAAARLRAAGDPRRLRNGRARTPRRAGTLRRRGAVLTAWA